MNTNVNEPGNAGIRAVALRSDKSSADKPAARRSIHTATPQTTSINSVRKFAHTDEEATCGDRLE